MPFYKVWYRNNPEPLETSSAGRLNEAQILDLVLKKEGIAAPVGTSSSSEEIIRANNLSPLRYTEDEGEPFTIG